MEEQLFRALRDLLGWPIAEARDARLGTPGLMPDNADLIAALENVRVQSAANAPLDAFWVLAGLLLYGPTVSPLTYGRLSHALDYVERWRFREGVNVFQGPDLLQLVFTYALGVRRACGQLSDEECDANGVWDRAPWSTAVSALERCLIGLGVWLVGELQGLGFRAVEVLSEFGRPHNRPELIIGRRLAQHTIGVLLGDVPCSCVELFLAANPGSRRGCAQRVHDEWHLLEGWLDHRWPGGRDYRHCPYQLGEFVFRAVIGDCPTHPRGFEHGIWFQLVRTADASLIVIQVLTCRRCRAHLDGFEACPGCGIAWPENALAYWLASEDDYRFRPGVGRECRRCGRLTPLDQIRCHCGSPGLGFTPTRRATGIRECLACGGRVPARLHSCPHSPCLNADYSSRETNFHFRHDGQNTPLVDGHARRRCGGLLVPLRSPDEVEEPDDPDEEEPVEELLDSPEEFASE